jgi:hypothetical protein
VAGRAFGIDALVGVELGGDGGEDALPAWIAHACAPDIDVDRPVEVVKYINEIFKISVRYFREQVKHARRLAQLGVKGKRGVRSAKRYANWVRHAPRRQESRA